MRQFLLNYLILNFKSKLELCHQKWNLFIKNFFLHLSNPINLVNIFTSYNTGWKTERPGGIILTKETMIGKCIHKNIKYMMKIWFKLVQIHRWIWSAHFNEFSPIDKNWDKPPLLYTIFQLYWKLSKFLNIKYDFCL